MTKIYVLEGRLSPKLVPAPKKTKVLGSSSVIMGRSKYTLVAEYPTFAVYTHRPKKGVEDVGTVCDLPLADAILVYPIVFVTHYTKDVDRNIKADVINIISGNIDPEPLLAPPPAAAVVVEEDDDDDISAVSGGEEEDEEEGTEDEEDEDAPEVEEVAEDEEEDDEVEQRVYSTRKRRRAELDGG